MNKKYFDMGSNNTLSDWITIWSWPDSVRNVEWPKWLTCPEHYKIKHSRAIFITTPLSADTNWVQKRFLESK